MPGKLKARENPLATNNLETLAYRFQDGDWNSFYERLKKMRYRGALVGPEGSGKTTLLFEIETKLKEIGFDPILIRLSGGKRSLPLHFWLAPLAKNNVVLVDSAENMPSPLFWILRLKCLSAAGLIITAHEEGLLPTLIRCETNIALLDDLIESLLGYRLDLERTAGLYRRSGGNLRLAFMHLYADI